MSSFSTGCRRIGTIETLYCAEFTGKCLFNQKNYSKSKINIRLAYGLLKCKLSKKQGENTQNNVTRLILRKAFT